MCSIAFIHNPDTDQKTLASAINRMNDLGARRGPDDSGIYLDDGIAVGHNRLSIIDPDRRSSQPMEFRDFVMVFNGCVYNYLELREELTSKGYEFTTSSDTEVVLKAFAEWGPDCLSRFNGMWAIVIYNKASGRVFIARDRYGIKPLYWYQNKGAFILASEIKQILPFSGTELHPGNQYDYFVYGRMVHNTSTLYRDVNVVPSGHYGWYDISAGNIQWERYYMLSVKPVSPDPDYLKFLIEDAVRIRLRSDVKNGITVSGGLDSSIISTIASSEEAGDLALFNASFPGSEEDESGYALDLANYLHRPIYLGNSGWADFTSGLGHLSCVQEIPVGSYAVFASFELQKLIAGKGVKVILSGQGADEIFGGYAKFHFYHLKNLLRTLPFQFVRELYYAWVTNQYSRSEMARKARSLRNRRRDPGYKWITRPEGPGEVHRDDFPSKEGLWEISRESISGMGLPVMLHALDRNSMYFGIESRCPFLDHRVVDYAVNLPDILKISNGKRKRILREIFNAELPGSVTRRYEKKGYSSPQGAYLDVYRTQVLKDIRDRRDLFPGFIDFSKLNSVLSSRSGKGLIWRVWTWLYWREGVLERTSEFELLSQ